MADIPMFPLGSVLFPAMPLPLRVFEERYLALLATVLADEPSEFGVVLIERGQEVGGGDARFDVGTVARITQLEAGEGFIAVLGVGTRRFTVTGWRDEAPYPVADVAELPELQWEPRLQPLREQAEQVVRRSLAVATEFVELPWSSDVQLADDPMEACWQLAAVAPLGPLDQVRLLGSDSLESLLTTLIEVTETSLDSIRFSSDIFEELPELSDQPNPSDRGESEVEGEGEVEVEVEDDPSGPPDDDDDPVRDR